MATTITPINELSPSKDEWTIKVRVIRLWKPPNFYKPTLGDNIELVLLDENVFTFFLFDMFVLCVSF